MEIEGKTLLMVPILLPCDTQSPKKNLSTYIFDAIHRNHTRLQLMLISEVTKLFFHNVVHLDLSFFIEVTVFLPHNKNIIQTFLVMVAENKYVLLSRGVLFKISSSAFSKSSFSNLSASSKTCIKESPAVSQVNRYVNRSSELKQAEEEKQLHTKYFKVRSEKPLVFDR